jgi:uncharacterized protein (DUF697 family)
VKQLKNIKLRQWHRIFSDARAEAERSLNIVVAGEAEVVGALIGVTGKGPAGVFTTVSRGEKALLKNVDLVVLAVHGLSPIGTELAELSTTAQKSGLDILAAVESTGLDPASVSAKRAEVEAALDLNPGSVAFFSADGADNTPLLEKIVGRLDSKSIALASKLPHFRPLVSDRVIQEIANQNGVVGLIGFIPGSDLPVLTANQIRMVLRLAAAFGVPMTATRVREVLLVIGSGFTFRSVARQLAGMVPIAGWAVKGAIAYSGTRAVGEMAKQYFSRINK